MTSVARAWALLLAAMLVVQILLELGGVYFVPSNTPQDAGSVRENPASYRPIYLPVDRSSGSGGGWGSGK